MKINKSICKNDEVALKIRSPGKAIKEDTLLWISGGESVAADVSTASALPSTSTHVV